MDRLILWKRKWFQKMKQRVDMEKKEPISVSVSYGKETEKRQQSVLANFCQTKPSHKHQNHKVLKRM